MLRHVVMLGLVACATVTGHEPVPRTEQSSARPFAGGNSPSSGPDRDSNGVLESGDRCPAEPETLNGISDDDGCADRVPEALAAALQPLRYSLREVKELMRGQMNVRIEQALLRLARAMRAHPEIRVEISFHRDSSWNPDYPPPCTGGQCLEPMRAALERAGVAPERISTSLPGADEPVDSNRTAAGRARNRRFEFNLLVR